MPGLRRAWRDAVDEPRVPTGRWLLVCALVLMVAAYARVLHAPFVYEDAMTVKPVSSLTWQDPQGWFQTGRAVTRLSLDANYLTDGLNPRGYHAVNVIVHGLNGVLVYRIGAALMPGPAAAFAAGLFLLHPIQTEAVSYVSGRSELLALCFMLAALWCVLGPLTKLRGVGFLLCAVAAMASKETGAAVVLLAPLLAWVTKQDREWYALIALLPVVGLLHAYEALWGNSYAFLNHAGGFGYLAYQCAALWKMVSLVLVPVGFTIDHDVQGWSRLVALVALAGVGAWLLAVVAALVARARVIALCLAWPLIVLAPRFFVRIIETLNEHQTYSAFIGLWFLIGLGAARLADPAAVSVGAWRMLWWRGRHDPMARPAWR